MKRPDITAEVALKRSEDGGRLGPILSRHFGCILAMNGSTFDVRLRLDEPFAPGEQRSVAIDFLDPSSASELLPGARFALRELREIATGIILTVQAERALS